MPSRTTIAALLLLTLTLGCETSSPPTGAGPGPQGSPTIPNLAGLFFDPLVVRRDGGTFRMSARVEGVDADRLATLHVELRSIFSLAPPSPERPVQRVLLDGAEVQMVPLRDDGIDGDVMGDGVFTSPPLTLLEEGPPPLLSSYPLFVSRIAWEFADTTFQVELEGDQRMRVTLYDMDPAIPIPDVEDLSTAVRRTRRVISLVMPPASPDVVGPFRRDVDISRTYYERFDHDPDFLVSYQPGIRSVAGSAAGYSPVRNDVTGIGLGIFDDTDRHSSPGRLQGHIQFFTGPNVTNHLLVHEIGHRWFAADLLDLDDGTFHWGGGLDRDFTGFTDGRYNDVELYLMGLIPADSVDPKQIGTDGTTIDDLVDELDPRDPAWPDAQDEFTMVSLVVFHRLLTPQELALFEFLAAEFGAEASDPRRSEPMHTFFEATGGRARMITEIP